MLIPCIELMGGHIVQLMHGEKKSLEIDDFEPWIKKFERFPVVHVVDLDAAMRTGRNNHDLVEALSKRLRCQVGGGITSGAQANAALAAGAKRVVVGSALVKNDKIDTDFAAGISKEVGRDKLVFAVDTKHGLLAYEGWRKTAPISVEDAIPQLNDYCGAFLHSHVETEGGMGGFPASVVRELVKLTHNQLIVGGGVKSMEEVQELDALGADAIVGMAVYKGVIPV